jgi:hypothetical protein
MRTVKQAIITAFAEKLREFYMRGVRDAHIDEDNDKTPSMLEPFDAGSFDEAYDKHVWLRIAENILDI